MTKLFLKNIKKFVFTLFCIGAVILFLVMTVNEKMKIESTSFLSVSYYLIDVGNHWEITDRGIVDQVRKMIEAVRNEEKPLQIDENQIKYGREDTAYILTFHDGKNTEEYFFGHDSVGSLNVKTGESYWQYASEEENYLALKKLIE